MSAARKRLHCRRRLDCFPVESKSPDRLIGYRGCIVCQKEGGFRPLQVLPAGRSVVQDEGDLQLAARARPVLMASSKLVVDEDLISVIRAIDMEAHSFEYGTSISARNNRR
jgi:hypothetical protein